MSADALPTVVTACLFAATVLAAFAWFHGLGRLQRLADVGGAADSADLPFPRVSVVVAARNEEEDMEATLRSLLALDYEDLEVLVANDRSTDRTGAIAEAVAAEDGRMKVIHIRELPSGWFGKNHAIWCAMKHATGRIALLTDADVSFSPDSVTRAVLHLEREGLDHLGVVVKCDVPGMMTRATVLAVGYVFVAVGRAWKVRDPESSAYFGVGPFNMVRVSSYIAAGGHKALRLDPVEDLMLGRLIKRAGFRSDVLRGSPLIRFKWYSSLRAMVHGLEKNTFASQDFRIGTIFLQTAALFVVIVLPFLLLPVVLWLGVTGWPGLLAFGAPAVLWLCGAAAAREHRDPLPIGLLLPVGTAILVYAVWRSTLVTIVRGVAWGGSPIPLSQLRAHRKEMLARGGSGS